MGESVVGYEGSFYRVALPADVVIHRAGLNPNGFVLLPVAWAATGDGEPQDSWLRAVAITSVRPS